MSTSPSLSGWPWRAAVILAFIILLLAGLYAASQLLAALANGMPV
jgi:hypothetical protein